MNLTHLVRLGKSSTFGQGLSLQVSHSLRRNSFYFRSAITLERADKLL